MLEFQRWVALCSILFLIGCATQPTNKDATHYVYAKPNNVRITASDGVNWTKVMYDRTGASDMHDERTFPIKFNNALTNKDFLITVRVEWQSFDDKQEYMFNLRGGVNTAQRVSPPISNKKYVQYLASSMSGIEKSEFICRNKAHDMFPNENQYNECVEYEKAEIAKIKKLETDKAEQKNFEDKLASKEGGICSKKLKSIENKENFYRCHEEEVRKSEAQKRFTEASNTEEGKFCLKNNKSDNESFWRCFNEKTTESKNIAADEIARQCVQIGFEYQSSQYRDCYLKLKIHTEQIASWQKLQNVLPKQQPNVIVQQNNSAAEVGALLDIAQRGLDTMSGANVPKSYLIPPPPPMQIITPRGNSVNCSMMGAALRCR